MGKEYQILGCTKESEWSSSYGPMVSYKMQLEGVSEGVKINQKPTTPPPDSGTIYGRVIAGKFGLEFKKEQKPEGEPQINSMQQISPSVNNAVKKVSSEFRTPDQIIRTDALTFAQKHYDKAEAETPTEEETRLAEIYYNYIKSGVQKTVEEISDRELNEIFPYDR